MSAVAERPEISTFKGSPDEVRAHLEPSHADRVLVLEFEHVSPEVFLQIAENLTNVADSMVDVLLVPQERASLVRLAEEFLPKSPPTPRLLKEAAMLRRSREAVLHSGDWLTAAEVAELAGLSTKNPSAQPNKWKKQRQIFAIHHGGVDYFPGYGLGGDIGFRPIKALTTILEVFDGHKDSWGMAYWFYSDNSFLGGKRPQDLLAFDASRVIAAAKDEVLGIVHG